MPGAAVATGSRMNRDAVGTLVLATAVIAASGGVVLLIAVLRVLWLALTTGTQASGDVLVVLGKRLDGAKPDADYRARLLMAARLAAQRPVRRIWVLGGRTAGASPSEAEAGERLLRCLPGGSALNIALEQASSHTLTNLRNLRELLGAADTGPLTLITNRYHLARVGQIAASLGLAHRLCAAEDRSAALRSTSPGRWLLEAFYLTWFAIGKWWAGLTRNQRMLARLT